MPIQVGERTRADGIVADVVGEHDDRSTAKDRREIDAVGEIEPLGIAQPVSAPGSAKVGQRSHVVPRYCGWASPGQPRPICLAGRPYLNAWRRRCSR